MSLCAWGTSAGYQEELLTVNVKSSGFQDQREASGMCLSLEYFSASSKRLFGRFSVGLWIDWMACSDSAGLMLLRGVSNTAAFTVSLPAADSQLRV